MVETDECYQWLAEVASFAKQSRHGAAQSGHKAKIEVAPPAPKKGAGHLFLHLVRLQFSLCAPIVQLRDAFFLQMTRLLQVTSTKPKQSDYGVAPWLQ